MSRTGRNSPKRGMSNKSSPFLHVFHPLAHGLRRYLCEVKHLLQSNNTMRKVALLLGALFFASAGGKLPAQEKLSTKLNFQESPKFTTGHNNPLLDFMFVADPTAVEYDGRLYVYGTNDTQQLDSVGPEGKNGYQHIHSLAMLSTDDMVNWTYHGLIDVKSLSPWGMASWAPSIVSRKESDGKTHFYLYYSNSGTGVGMLTATSPVGPWSDPLGHMIVDSKTPGLGHCPAPFDPGAVIDDEGIGWLSFGGGGKGDHGTDYLPGVARIVRLGKDMKSLDSQIVEIEAPYHFEANELNYWNGTWIYTYNTDWQERPVWPYEGIEKPTRCCIPPDNWLGYWSLKAKRLALSKAASANWRRFSLATPLTSRPYSVFSKMVLWGKRPKFWKTMLIFSRRTWRSSSSFILATSLPSI